MARRVFFHVGTLKTGTTYLQRVLWLNREALAEAGVLVAGESYTDRVAATRSIRGLRAPDDDLSGSPWARIVDQVRDFDGDAVISHEFFGGASSEQASRALSDLAPAEVHVVCTARDLSGVMPGFWQEHVKFGYDGRYADYEPDPLDASPKQHWSWRTIDAADVLRRWSAEVPAERVHVVTFPTPGAPRDLLWRRFAEVCGFDPALADLDIPAVNESLGVVESELLRRVNTGLHDELRALGEPARWVRRYLGLEILAPRKGEKLRVDPARVDELRRRSREIADQIREAGYSVVGDLDDLLVPDDLTLGRMPEDVGEDELLDVALDVINRMLSDYRKVSLENRDLRARLRAARAGAASPRARPGRQALGPGGEAARSEPVGRSEASAGGPGARGRAVAGRLRRRFGRSTRG